MAESEVDVSSYTEAPKPGLAQAKQLIDRYRTILAHDGSIDEKRVHIILNRYGLEREVLVRPTIYSSYSKPQSEIVVRTDATNVLLDKLRKRGEDKLLVDSMNEYVKKDLPEDVKEYGIQNLEQRLNTDFDELEEVLHFSKYINEAINQSAWPPGYSVMQRKMDEVVRIYKARTVQSLIKRSDELFTEDVLKEDLPHLREGLTQNQKLQATELLNATEKLMVITKASKDLKNDYSQPFSSLVEEIKTEIDKFKFESDVRLWSLNIQVGLLDDFNHPQQVIRNLSKLLNGEAWQNLVVSPEQTKQIYDAISPILLTDLFKGGHESWEGTHAAAVFFSLRDPRVLPSLIEHLQEFGSGHTSAVVASAIEEIANKPLDKGDLEEVLLQLSPFERSIVNKMFRNSDAAIFKIMHPMDGYNAAVVIQDAEHFLPRGDLLDLAIEIAKSHGEEIDTEVLRGFFYNNDYVDSSKVEGILLENLDKTALLIAKSKSADWRSSSPKLFTALVSPVNGDIAKFPNLIILEGMGLGGDYSAKLEKLYQSGDLKRGVMARTTFAEGLLFLSSKDEGADITRDILDKSSGATRDAERIRKIFVLLRSLDGMGQFEYPKKTTLNETILDLKNKLVSVVGEKMELSGEDLHFLHENLDDLLKTGIFEIIPPLLSKFNETKKEQVANCVREIGRHIVIGDFKAWRNSSEAARKQLSVLSEDKQGIWLNESKESIQELGINKQKEVRLGALDAIKRIAAEAKAHILEIYKLDFSITGVNALKYKQKELVLALKGNKEIQEKKDLGEQKRKIDDEIRIIEGLLGLESLSLESLESTLLSKSVSSILNSMSTFQGMDQPASDLTQIAEVLTTQEEIGNVSVLRAYDTDDPFALLKVGIEPRETCQSYRGGSHNYCLPAYVADANKRVINVDNEKREVLGRSVMKLTHVTTSDGSKHPAILLEPVYTTSEIIPIYRGVARVALEKAKAIGAYLIMVREFNVATGADHKRTIPVIEQEAKRSGREIKNENLQVFVPQSLNSYEYSDSLGGDISYFEIYHTLNDALIVMP